jgi:hypothetical protein
MGEIVNTMHKRLIGGLLVLVGGLIAIFSGKIVFPGLELLLGIETIVGKENVEHLEGGGYIYTNPGAMIRWICSVAAVGVVLCGVGVWMLVRAQRFRCGQTP